MNDFHAPAWLLALALWLVMCGGCAPDPTCDALRAELAATYGARQPREWGETVRGVKTHLATGKKVIALTLDACGGATGQGIDEELIRFLETEKVPATLFLNGRWIDAHPERVRALAENPLFTIANHGLRHRPASVGGRSAYGIAGTGSVGELMDEIALNAEKIRRLTGITTRYYRSGTAYYDELAVRIAGRLGHRVVGFAVLGDAGATYSRDQVAAALLASTPGAIVILHMNHPQSGTAAGVAAAVPELRRKGYRFVSLDDYRLRRGPARRRALRMVKRWWMRLPPRPLPDGPFPAP